MKWRRFFSTVLVVAMLATGISGCNPKVKIKKNSFDSEIKSTPITDTFIAENENYTLSFNEVTMGISLKNKQTGELFGTNPLEEGEQQFDELGMPIKKHPQIQSVLFIDYLNVETNITTRDISYTAVVKENRGRTVFKKTDNGVKINYYFDDAEIMVPIEYTLRDDGVALTVDPAEIQENDNMLISVSVAPFWCSVKNDAEGGYIMYPSGSGTLVYAKEISQQGENYVAEVYGTDVSKEISDKISTEKSIRLPVFGATNGKKASLGIIEQGAESSLLNMTVGSTSIGYSSVYVTYQLRGYTTNVKELYNNRYYEGFVYSNNMIETPLTIGFYPLTGEGVGYSKMAETYRDYLDKTNGKADGTKNSTLDITMVGGAMISKSFLGIPYKTLYPTTTLSQAKDIITDLRDSGADVTNITLYGFGQNGIDSNKLAGDFKIDGSLGNKKDLKKLTDKAGDASVYFDFDTVGFTDSGNGFSNYFDAAVRANRKTAKLYTYDIAVLGKQTEGAYSILARKKLADAVEKLEKKTKDWGMDGIGLSALSSIAYSDYTDKANGTYYAKAGMAKQVADILKGIDGRQIMTSDANIYAAVESDLVINAPTVSSRARVFDADIPFYAMVLRGRTSLSSESINLSSRPEEQFLRAVEGGMGISYTLTAKYSTKLIDINSTVFYNSLYTDLKDSIVSNYKSVSDYYEKISDSRIVEHNILDSGLRETVFENGIKVFVNYSDKEISSAAGAVPAKSFLVWEASV